MANPANRFDPQVTTRMEPLVDEQTSVTEVHSRTIIARNRSPDVPFEQSINSYRGCEHGCIYCFARPTHAFLDLSPGLDFETRLFAKINTVELLVKELSRPGYVCKAIALGTNTDPYQPVEKRYRLTRGILKTMLDCRHPVSILTKGQGVLRDIEIISELAALGLASVMVSIPSFDRGLKRTLEPRAASARSRLKVIETLAAAGIPTGVMVAPVIPKLTDHEMEGILRAVRDAGGTRAGYVMLRLPLEVRPLFEQWLQAHYPLKARSVMSIVSQLHGGKAYDSQWSARQTGKGVFADLYANRFSRACARFGINSEPTTPLRTDLFRRPQGQLSLF